MTKKDYGGLQRSYTRREALAAMAKYSTAVGGTAATIISAEGLVSEASAYPAILNSLCRRNPSHWLCSWDGWDEWEDRRGGRNGRVRF